MNRVKCPARLPASAFALGLAVLPLATAAAQEYCVACTEPNAVYRCVIEQAVPTSASLKMLCIGALAREGGHATCAVRSGTVFDCNGPIRRIDARSASDVLGGAIATPANASPVLTPPDPAAKPENAPPGTVEEVAKQMSKSSGEALGKAGEVTRKAWGCVASLFKSC